MFDTFSLIYTIVIERYATLLNLEFDFNELMRSIFHLNSIPRDKCFFVSQSNCVI